MHFGLTNALAIMQRLIDRVLAPHKKYALAYMDDIIIFSPTFEQHLEHASAVLRTLLEHRLAIKLLSDKCRFAHRKVRFLGFIVSDQGISTDPAYVRAVTDFPSPDDKSLTPSKRAARVMEFCEMVGYYRRFARGLADLEKPLRALTLKDGGYGPPSTKKLSTASRRPLALRLCLPIRTFLSWTASLSPPMPARLELVPCLAK